MMKNLPWLSLGIGLFLALLTMLANPLPPGGETAIPLLAILFMTELGALLCLVAVLVSIREQLNRGFQLHGLLTTVGNGLLLAYFLNFGMNLWMAIS
ncbi:MAG: hypothetical protein OEX12_00970 [Gammaproteobacteria bacterium]|nr:hypothetical protein [Gammaproteobacteria bacterium]